MADPEVSAAILSKHRPLTLERIAFIADAVAALGRGKLDAGTRAQACGDAHNLAGSLGLYGIPAGSEIARRLDQALEHAPAPADAPALAADVSALRRAVEAAPFAE
jgi:HPt (histidine-containing phosphotransfer) domain-containing protein